MSDNYIDAMVDDDMRAADVREMCCWGEGCQFQATYDGFSSCNRCGKTSRDFDYKAPHPEEQPHE